MIHVQNVTHGFGGREVLRDVSFRVGAGECVSVIGPNGSGKSTLLRIVGGELDADAGHVDAPPRARTGYLRQSSDRAVAALRELFPALAVVLHGEALLVEAAAALAAATAAELPARERAYDELLTGISRVATPEVIEGAAHAMGADPGWLDAAPPTLSGGEIAKLALLDLVAAQPEVLLLDEPTNHLDTTGIAWLTRHVEAFPGPVLLVSHDRAFLDAVTDVIVALDPATGVASIRPGGYSPWAEEQERRRAEQWQVYERERREDRALRRTISAIESRSRSIEQGTIHFHYRKRAKKVARQSTVLKARLQRQAAAGERTERPAKGPLGLRAGFSQAAHAASRLVEAEGVTVAIGDRVLIEDCDLMVEREARVFVTGANGSGKTALLSALLGATEADRSLVRAGSVRVAGSARPGVMAQETAVAWPGTTPLEVIRRAAGVSEVEAVNLLHRFVLAHDLARQPLDALSEGERRRLQLAMLIAGGANLLVLDEPTNHLDLAGREAFEAALAAYDGAVLAVSHDRYFVERFATEEWAIEGRRVMFVTCSSPDG